MSEEKTLLNVSASPHIRAKQDTSFLMKMVIAALIPAALCGVVVFGPRALMVLALSIISSVCFEALMDRLLHKPSSIQDCSAVVTGLLLGMNLPASVPWWLPILGSAFAIIIVKMLFGGLGQNFMNPALGADLLCRRNVRLYRTEWCVCENRRCCFRCYTVSRIEIRRADRSDERLPWQYQGYDR